VSRRRRAARGRGGDHDWRASLRLAAVLAVLVGVNVYVFFFAPGSLKQVSQAAQAAQTGEPIGIDAPPTRAGPVVAAAAGKGTRKEGMVHEHEGLGAALRREGLAAADADHVLRALAPIMGFKRDVHGGQRYTLRIGADGQLEGFELKAGKGVVFTVARVDGKWLGRKAQSSTAAR
jgi:hypothetical protein